MKLLDSDFIIALLKRDPAIEPALQKFENSKENIGTTIFSAHEVWFGVSRKNKELAAVTERLFDSLPVLHYDFKAMHTAIELIHSLDQKGRRIGIFDELIAAICISQEATLVTRNVRHFKRIDGLSVESW